MAEQNEQPAPHGDPMRREVGNQEENRAQRDSDAPPDATTEPRPDGIPEFDEAEGEQRRKLYDSGAELVSRID